MNSLFMGVDIGTSSVKAALFDREGKQVSLYHKEYPLICNEDGMAEIDPDKILGSLLEVIKTCLEKAGVNKNNIEAMAFSTQLFSLMGVDRNGNPVTNLYVWADSRSINESREIQKNHDVYDLYCRTGCRPHHPMYPLSKVLWLKNNYKHLYENIDKLVSIKEYVIYRLFGEFAIDITDASTTGFFNIHEFKWDEDILKDVLGMGKDKLGSPVDCTQVFNGMKSGYAKAMGLREDITVAIGSGDGMLANLGCGVFDDTSMSFTIGTSGALRISLNKPLLDREQRTWCYCFTRDTWVAGGAVNNGGIVLKWLRDSLREQFEHDARNEGLDNIYKLFDKYASQIGPGCENLIFLPHLTGERSPGWNAEARATIHGLGLVHGKKHIIRAAMEGVMYKMYSIYEVITQINDNVEVIVANGGYVNSDLWVQIQADIFNRKIAVAGVGEAAAFGAAYAAMVAAGALDGFKEKLPGMNPSKIVEPIPDNHIEYRKVYNNFIELYKSLY